MQGFCADCFPLTIRMRTQSYISFLYFHRRAVYLRQQRLYFRERAPYLRKRALYRTKDSLRCTLPISLQPVAVSCSVFADPVPLFVLDPSRQVFMKEIGMTASHCYTLQHTATHCYTLLHTTTHYNTLQHTATHLMTRACC